MRRGIVFGLLGAVVVFTQSCAVPYYAQAVSGQLELVRKRTPIGEVVAQPGTDPELVAQLEQVQRIRNFASASLGLPDNDSYRSYADLGRPYVVWNVVAAEEFSVDPQRWCFLFVGCLSYRGFFKQAAAAEFADRLKNKGLDTVVGGVTAYSTLGYFADPVLNTMLERGGTYVAGVIFHELAHQRVYVKGDSAFSEAFATVVEEYGTEQWLVAQGDGAAVTEFRSRVGRRGDVASLIERTLGRLRVLYASPRDAQDMRRAKQAAFTTLRDEYAELRAGWGGETEYDNWFASPLNNAALASIATYRRWVPFLRQQLRDDGDIELFFATVERLAKLDSSEREQQLDVWQATVVD